MNKLIIIGNLTKDPVLRTTQSGLDVCSFTVAVNRKRRQEGQPEADYFNVSAWREMGMNCAKYLAKGRKVMVCGTVGIRTYSTQDGRNGATMEVTADDVEFLTPRDTVAYQDTQPQRPAVDPQSGMQQVDMDDELPF